jgi:hypothetical protein
MFPEVATIIGSRDCGEIRSEDSSKKKELNQGLTSVLRNDNLLR